MFATNTSVMITSLNLGSFGRLGNQLFQYAALKGASLNNNLECKIPNPTLKAWHGQRSVLGDFNLRCALLSEQDIATIKYNVSDLENYKQGGFQNILSNLLPGTNIHGYFQNINYFKGHEEQIKKELTPKKKYIDAAKSKLNELRKDGHEIVSLHIRRGDHMENAHLSKCFGSDPLDQNTEYGKFLTEAMTIFGEKKVKYYIFTGGSHSGDDTVEINWAKKCFGNQCYVSDSNNAVIDFALISQCDHHIVSPVSTFSWWAAYVNDNSQKTVIALKDFFFDGMIEPNSGFFPENWILL